MTDKEIKARAKEQGVPEEELDAFVTAVRAAEAKGAQTQASLEQPVGFSRPGVIAPESPQVPPPGVKPEDIAYALRQAALGAASGAPYGPGAAVMGGALGAAGGLAAPSEEGEGWNVLKRLDPGDILQLAGGAIGKVTRGTSALAGLSPGAREAAQIGLETAVPGAAWEAARAEEGKPPGVFERGTVWGTGPAAGALNAFVGRTAKQVPGYVGPQIAGELRRGQMSPDEIREALASFKATAEKGETGLAAAEKLGGGRPWQETPEGVRAVKSIEAAAPGAAEAEKQLARLQLVQRRMREGHTAEVEAAEQKIRDLEKEAKYATSEGERNRLTLQAADARVDLKDLKRRQAEETIRFEENWGAEVKAAQQRQRLLAAASAEAPRLMADQRTAERLLQTVEQQTGWDPRLFGTEERKIVKAAAENAPGVFVEQSPLVKALQGSEGLSMQAEGWVRAFNTIADERTKRAVQGQVLGYIINKYTDPRLAEQMGDLLRPLKDMGPRPIDLLYGQGMYDKLEKFALDLQKAQAAVKPTGRPFLMPSTGGLLYAAATGASTPYGQAAAAAGTVGIGSYALLAWPRVINAIMKTGKGESVLDTLRKIAVTTTVAGRGIEAYEEAGSREASRR